MGVARRLSVPEPLSFVAAVRAAANLSALREVVAEALEARGFEQFIFVPDDDDGRMLRRVTPEARDFLGWYVDHDLIAIDPVHAAMRRSRYPVPWSAEAQMRRCGRDARERELWQRTYDAGFRFGVSVPVHGPRGTFDHLVGISRRRWWQTSADLQGRCDELLTLANLLSAVYHEGFAEDAEEVPALSTRERECLAWTAQGKTAWEVGRILAITERTVNFHLQNAMRKLDCATKHHATAKAQRLGLLLDRRIT